MSTKIADEELRLAKALQQRTSDVQFLDPTGLVYQGFYVWCDEAPAVKNAPELMFAKCLVLPDSTPAKVLCQQVDPADATKKPFTTTKEHIWNANAGIDPSQFGDMGALTHTNVPSLLDFAKQRFSQKIIYTTAEPLLIIINPYVDLGNATDAIIAKYRDSSDLRKLAPHVFGVARQALESVHSIDRKQSIIVSGESGSGKTEATKHIMRYFAAAKVSGQSSNVQDAVMAANPVLEAFGNAKTVRNNNSSRFGRYMQLDVLREGGITAGKVQVFLLEKSRVITQDVQERSYHIFYQLLKGAPTELRKTLNLLNVDQYAYINPKCVSAHGIDDAADFEAVHAALIKMGLTEDETRCVYSLLSGILLLGNVQVSKGSQTDDDAATIGGDNLTLLTTACDLLALPFEGVLEALTVKITVAGKQEIRGTWSVVDCEMLKASLAKAIYEQLFLSLTRRLNGTISTPDFKGALALLDIFGFEMFENNSLEQLFINGTNEMLQQAFVSIVFERETKLHKAQGLTLPKIDYTTNQPIMDAIMLTPTCALSLLADQCIAPGSTDKRFVSNLLSALKENKIIKTAKKSTDISFIVEHTIGPISYNAAGFIFKNRDILRPELVQAIQKSSNPMVASFFPGITPSFGKIGKDQLIGSQFQTQLKQLTANITTTECHFCRCVKPNEEKAPLKWIPAKVSWQFYCLSIYECVGLSISGFPYHRLYAEFLQQFRHIIPGSFEAAGDNFDKQKVAAEKIIQAAEIPSQQHQFGKTMMFLKKPASLALTQLQRERLADWMDLVHFLDAALVRRRRYQALIQASPYLARFSAHLRRIIRDSSALTPIAKITAAPIQQTG